MLAIDLGSSNTVAVRRDAAGQLRSVLFDGAELLPSGVYAGGTGGPAGTGGLVVGADAQRLARADPAGYEPYPKRRVDDGTVLLGGRPVDVRDVLAAVLARAVPAGTTEAVLTYPASWGPPRRQVLLDAAERAGLHRVELVSEPIAAAAYFCAVLGNELPPGAALAVVDLGAGTAGVAVVSRTAGGLDVVAEAGLQTGGADLDAALVEHLGDVVSAGAPEAWTALGKPTRDRLVLWQEVRAAKESLSRLSSAPVHVPGYPVELHLTRDELDAVATPLLTPVAELAAQVIAAAGRAPAGLAGVFLVGGGSRIPLLARLLHTRLGVAPTMVERPETVVAEGALHAVHPDGAVPPDGVVPPQELAPALVAPARPARRRRRWLGPVTLVLAVLCFLLPFATVSCVPDGYGRADPGGTTTYTGVDLAISGQPSVTAGHLRPVAQRKPDRLPPQPALLGALLVAVAATVAAIVVPLPRRRRALVASLATAAALLLLVGEAVATDLLAARVRAQSALPPGKVAKDFVGAGLGFWLGLLLLVGAVTGNAIGLVRAIGRPAWRQRGAPRGRTPA